MVSGLDSSIPPVAQADRIRSRICVRIIGETEFTYPSAPGVGADQIETRWRVGREVMVLVPRKAAIQKTEGEFVGRWCRLIDWFQPDGDPALTVYVFESVTEESGAAPSGERRSVP